MHLNLAVLSLASTALGTFACSHIALESSAVPLMPDIPQGSKHYLLVSFVIAVVSKSLRNSTPHSADAAVRRSLLASTTDDAGSLPVALVSSIPHLRHSASRGFQRRLPKLALPLLWRQQT